MSVADIISMWKLTVNKLCTIRTLCEVLLEGIAAVRDGGDGRLIDNGC